MVFPAVISMFVVMFWMKLGAVGAGYELALKKIMLISMLGL